MAKTKKLFEYLVIREQLKQQTRKLTTDLMGTFEKKRHLFEEKRKTYTPLAEGAAPMTEEQSDIQTTVEKELKWLFAHWAKSIDVARQVEEGNTAARADVVLDSGTTLLTAVPATALLELAQRADEIQALIQSVPTLDPSKAFREDPEKGAGIFKARDITKTRTQKKQQHIVVVPPTDHHPAQVAVTSEDVPVGTLLEMEWSGLITPSRKADMLARIEEIRRAIKQALQRANAVDVTFEPTAGEAIFNYIMK